MRGRPFFRDERGAVTADWVVLTAGILILGIIVAISVMENSGGYLMDEFESLNEKYAQDALALSERAKDKSFDN